MILLIGLATMVSTFLGGYFALRFKDKLHLIIGFSAGAVLGVALFDLMPEAFNLGIPKYNLSLVTLLIAVGFIVYMIFDRFFSLHFHGNDEEDCENPSHRGQLAVTSLCFHSFLDGLGIGLAFKVSPTVGWVVASAVLAHDFSDGINTVSLILKNKGEKSKAFQWLIIDALAPFIGIIVAYFIVVSESTLGLILAVFAGLFLYIGASDLIPESHHSHPSFWTTFTTILGIALLYLIINIGK
jgi:ZIP family zinc transporter